MNTRIESAADHIGFFRFWDSVDRGVVTGIGLSIFLMLAGIFAAGHISSYFDPGSVLIVVGGTFAATLVHYSPADLRQAYQSFKNVLIFVDNNPVERIVYLVELSKLVRREGTLVLESESARESDLFVSKGLGLIADGQNVTEIKRVLENELRTSIEHQRRAIQVLNTMGTFAPAMGFIGTLIGLVALLDSLNNPSAIGPAMAIALTTTLYGAVLSNMVFLPISGKLKVRGEEELLIKQITIEGMLCIAQQENPLVVQQRLESFLPVTGGQ